MKEPQVDSDFRFYLLFLVKVFSIYLAWRLFELIIGTEAQPFDQRFFPQVSFYWEWLNNQVRLVLLHSTRIFLSLLGYTSFIENDYIVYISGYKGVAIGNYCLAFQFMFFFTGLIFLSPFPPRVKLWSVPVGIIIIQALNVLRFAGINLVIIYSPELAGKMHDYFFNVIVLVITLLAYLKLLSRYD